jgi:hypothetical protein
LDRAKKFLGRQGLGAETSTARDFPLGERGGNGDDARMGSAGDWELSKALARAILHDRGQRRKWLGRWLLLTVAWMAIGLWVLDGLLSKNAWMFALWWVFCFFLACVLVVFALYDVLAVMREEGKKSDERFAEILEEHKKSRDE